MTAIAKTGHNDHFDYDFFEEREVLRVARLALTDCGLAFHYSVGEVIDREVRTKNDRMELITDVRMRCTIADAELGGVIEGDAYGRAQDGQDKGVNKAIVAGLKYWLLKELLIGTEDDTESTQNTNTDGNAPRRRKKRSGGGEQSEVNEATIECPKCGGGMWDNRKDKKNPKAPDFKCKNKECTDGSGYQTGLWWRDVATRASELTRTALAANLMSAETATRLEALVKQQDAPRVFGALAALERKIRDAGAEDAGQGGQEDEDQSREGGYDG